MVSVGLRYFASVASQGSFRRAADDLHIAQSALSRQIHKLEEDFGARLFERRARGVQLTAAGEIFLRHVKATLRQVERVRSELDALKGLRRGTVRLQSIESLVQHLLPRAIAEFSARHPGITFDVTIDGSDHIVAAVRDGRTDIGLAFYPQGDRDLTTAFKMREPLVALMSPGHPLARRTRVTLADCVVFPIALPVANSGSRILIDVACKSAGLYIAPVLETNSVQLMVHFCHVNHGITFLSQMSAWNSLRAGDLVAVPIRDRIVNRATIDVITHASRELPLAAEEFLRSLKIEFQRSDERSRNLKVDGAISALVSESGPSGSASAKLQRTCFSTPSQRSSPRSSSAKGRPTERQTREIA